MDDFNKVREMDSMDDKESEKQFDFLKENNPDFQEFLKMKDYENFSESSSEYKEYEKAEKDKDKSFEDRDLEDFEEIRKMVQSKRKDMGK